MITPQYRQKASQAAAQHFLQSSYFQDFQHIACYQALASELDTEVLIEALWQADKACYLPLTPSGQEKILRFARYEKNQSLKLNCHGVLEPSGSSEIISGSELEVVILPLLAFDHQGNRLGTGGGYYDHTFAFTREMSPKKPHLIGLAYALQQVSGIPEEAFDVPLEAVITEEGLQRVKT